MHITLALQEVFIISSPILGRQNNLCLQPSRSHTCNIISYDVANFSGEPYSIEACSLKFVPVLAKTSSGSAPLGQKCCPGWSVVTSFILERYGSGSTDISIKLKTRAGNEAATETCQTSKWVTVDELTPNSLTLPPLKN